MPDFRRHILFIFQVFIITQILSFWMILPAQNQFDKWVFGNRASLNFSSGSPVVTTGAMLNTTEGSASIADSLTGNLLFYTDGLSVWNSTHAIMSNGTGLNGNGTTTQSAIIVPQPGNPGIYYIVTIPYSSASTPISYSTVNMSLSGGLGSVVLKNQPMAVGNTVAEKVTAIRHCNGADWWIITHQFNSNNYMAWLLTSTGMASAPVISGAGTSLTSSTGKIGYLTPSPDGSKLAFPIYNGNTLDIVDFDRTTGMVSNPIILTGFTSNYGNEFSASGRYLYVTSFQTLYQFDLISNVQATIQASQVTITTEANWIRAMRRGKDNKIYVVREFLGFLGVINNPDAAGLACNYVASGINLAPNSNTLGIPNNYAWAPGSCAILDISGLTLTGEVRGGLNHLRWEISSGFDPMGMQAELQRSEPELESWEPLAEWEDFSQAPSEYSETPGFSQGANYRLMIRDRSGREQFSNIIYLQNDLQQSYFHLYPNPTASNQIWVEWQNPTLEAIQFTCTDMAGKALFSETVYGSMGKNLIDLHGIRPGIYLVKLRLNGIEKVEKLIVE